MVTFPKIAYGTGIGNSTDYGVEIYSKKLRSHKKGRDWGKSGAQKYGLEKVDCISFLNFTSVYVSVRLVSATKKKLQMKMP